VIRFERHRKWKIKEDKTSSLLMYYRLVLSLMKHITVMNDETKCEKNNLNKNKTKTKDNVLRERTNTEKERKKLNSPTI